MRHFTLLYFILCSSFFFSQKSICGDWVGHLETQGSRLKIVFHISSKKNVLSGTMDSPDQGAYGLNMNSILFTDPSVLFDLSVFGIKYQGLLVQQDSISGEFSQGEFNTKLNLKKSSTAIASRPNRPQEPKTPLPYNVQEVKFTNETAGITLAGTLTTPKGRGRNKPQPKNKKKTQP